MMVPDTMKLVLAAALALVDAPDLSAAVSARRRHEGARERARRGLASGLDQGEADADARAQARSRRDRLGERTDQDHRAERDGHGRAASTVRGAATFQARGVTHIEEAMLDKARNIDGRAEGRAGAATNAEHERARRVSREKARDSSWRTPASPCGTTPICPVELCRSTSTIATPSSCPIDAGEIRVQFRNGETRTTKLVPGEVLFFSGADAHSEEASVGSPRVIAIELK